ncbi:MAG: DUF1833 family protein [Rhodospirillaceae bacterium]|nr:DUF1833 family protein [Rhodospirillaceae bacterium]
MALPYTLDLPHHSRSATTSFWRGTVPAARLASATEDQTIQVAVTNYPDFGILAIDVDIGGSGSRVDLTDELEGARWLLQNSDGSATFWRGEPDDSDEPYGIEPSAAEAAALHAYTGTLRLRFETASTPVDVRPAGASTAAPTATAQAQVRGGRVEARPAGGALAAPSAVAQLEVVNNPRDVRPAPAALPAPSAAAAVAVVGPVTARPAGGALAAPSAWAPVGVVDPGDEAAIARRALAPERRILTCIEISHPAADATLYMVDDAQPVTIGGQEYLAARFEAKAGDDVDRRAPRGQIVIGNVGRVVSDWVDEADGGTGGTARIFEILEGAAAPDWEIEMDIAGVHTGEVVTVTLGFDPLLGRPAVALRYDPQTAPGLF